MKKVFIVFDGDTYHPSPAFATEAKDDALTLSAALYGEDKSELNVAELPLVEGKEELNIFSAFYTPTSDDDPKVGGTDE